MKTTRTFWSILTMLIVTSMLLAACGAPATEDPAMPEEPAASSYTDNPWTEGEDLSGTSVVVFGAFAEEEAGRFEEAMAPFEEATGIDVSYEGSQSFETVIVTKLEGGDPPDLAGFPQPGVMARFASDAIDITNMVDMSTLQNQYAQSWLDMATVDGKTVGIWHRVTVKSLVWYPPAAFAANGYEVPTTWDEMIALSDKMVADGYTPWYGPMESGPATGWVGTDFIEDIMLRTTSLENYDKWTTGELPFSSPEVKRAWELMGQILLNEDYVYGGITTTLTASFFDSGKPLLEDPPDAFLVHQGSAMAGWLDPIPEVGPEGALNFFGFPSIDPEYGTPALVAGDVYSVFNDRPEVRALVRYMITADSLESWIKTGGVLSPHKDIASNLDWFPTADRVAMEILLNAGDNVRFDGGDLMPGAVGAGTFWTGVVDYINGGDLDTILADIDASWPR